MSAITKNFLDFAGLSEYDSGVKAWSNTANQLGYKTVLSDGNNLYFFKKPNATDQEYAKADKTISLGGADASDKLNALAAIIDATATYDATNKVWSINLASGFAASTVVGAINELLTDIGDVDDLDITLATGETAPADIVAAANLLNDHIDAIADTIANMDGTATIATVSNNVVTIKGGVKQIAGEIENKTTLEAADVVLEEVAVTGAAEDVSVADSGNKFTATNVEGVLAELADNVAGKTVYFTDNTSTSGTDYATIYKLYQGDGNASSPVASELIGTINIPKDQFVDDAAIVNITYDDGKLYDGLTDVTELIKGAGGTATAADAGKYFKIVFELASGPSAKSTIYISVKELSHVYTGGATAEISVAVDPATDVITATVVDVAATKVTYIAADSAQGIARESVGAALARIDGDANTAGSINKAKADVIGTNADTASANTVYGAKAYADDAVDTAINGLDTASDVAIASVDNSGNIVLQNGISETDGVIEQGAGDGIIIAPIATADIQGLFS